MRCAPAVTGWAQINGRNDAGWPEKLAMDTWYVDNMSLALDLKILMRTVTAVLARHGISAEGHATAPELSVRDSLWGLVRFEQRGGRPKSEDAGVEWWRE